MKAIILLPLLIVALLTGCEKELIEHQLPPYSQEGNNIFACKINGEVFIAEGVLENNTLSPTGVDHYWSLNGNDTVIYIHAQEEKPAEASISLKFIFDSLLIEHELNQKERSVAIVYLPVDNYIFAKSKFATNEEHKGWVQVKYFQNDVLAGTFEFTAIDARGEIIHVTEGRFDVSYKE